MGSGEGALGYENIWLEERIQPHRFSDGRRSVLNLGPVWFELILSL